MNDFYRQGFAHALIFIIGGVTFVSFLMLWSGSYDKEIFIALVPAIFTLAAAFIGAKLAFQYQLQKEEIKVHAENKEKAEILLFKMGNMVNGLVNIDIQIFLPGIKFGDYKFLAIKPVDTGHLRIDTNHFDIYFLFRGENANDFGHIAVAINSYDSFLNNLDLRSKLNEKAQDKISLVLSQKPQEEESVELYRTILGERDYFALVRITDDLVNMIDDTISKMVNGINILGSAIGKEFKLPEHYRINLEDYIEIKKKHNESFNADSLKLAG